MYNRTHFNFLIALLALLLTSPLTSSVDVLAKEKFTVVIDPGHGGGDIGTPHRKQKKDEKTVALDVALRLGQLIESSYNDVKVVYTRKTDIYPTLPERTQIAKKAKGDLFISIHVNAAPDAAARGFETYVFGVSGEKSKSADEKKRLQDRMEDERENLDINGKQVNFDTDIDIETKILCQAQREKHNKQSLEVANDIHNALIKELKRTSYGNQVNNRGVKPKNLFVLCYSPMPAILIELGYMSNVAEERFINSEEGENCFAHSIFEGFKKYKRGWDKRQLKNSDLKEVEPAEPAETKTPKAETTTEPAKEKPAEVVAEQPAKQMPEPKMEQPKSKQGKATNKTEEPKAEQPAPIPTKPAAKVPTQEITWKVQFLTSGKVLKKGDPALKGLWPVDYYQDGKVYKYTYGSGASMQSLNGDLKKVKALFKDAFPVKFDAQGKRIK